MTYTVRYVQNGYTAEATVDADTLEVSDGGTPVLRRHGRDPVAALFSPATQWVVIR